MSAIAIENNPAVVYAFGLYVLYVLLPLIPAILIFRLFPDTKVTVSGPLQNLTLNSTGAFAAYVVTAALGFLLVRNVEEQIMYTRHYPVEGIVVDLERNQYLDSDQFYYRYSSDGVDPNGQLSSRNYSFVLVLDHPVLKPETVWVKYWDVNGSGGLGAAPSAKKVRLDLLPSSAPQRFRLRVVGGEPELDREASGSLNQERNMEVAMKGGQ